MNEYLSPYELQAQQQRDYFNSLSVPQSVVDYNGRVANQYALDQDMAFQKLYEDVYGGGLLDNYRRGLGSFVRGVMPIQTPERIRGGW